MKQLILLSFVIFSTQTNAVVNYDQFDEDSSADLESAPAPSSPAPSNKSEKKVSREEGAVIGFPSLEYSSVKRQTNPSTTSIVPRGGKEMPTHLSKWDFGIRMDLDHEVGIRLGVPMLETKSEEGKHSEFGNPVIDIAAVWFQGRDPEPMKVEFLLHTSAPRKGRGVYYAHSRWDLGAGLGTSKRFGKLNMRLEGKYIFKRSSSGAEYEVGDMLNARAGLALSVTRELDFQVVGDFKRAYSLKQDDKKLISGANLNTISPQMVVHMNSTVDLLVGGVFVSNRGALDGKEHAFGDISYDGILGDQVTLGLSIEI